MADIEDRRADATERGGTLLVFGLWIATTAVILLGWPKGLEPPWVQWGGLTVLALVAIVPQIKRLLSFLSRRPHA